MREPWRDALRGPWSITEATIDAGAYDHEPSAALQLRLVRQGSSFAEIDLGAGPRPVFTRTGDFLLSLPDTPTSFRLDSPRRLLVLQMEEGFATELVRLAGGRDVTDLGAVATRPFRDPFVAGLCRHLRTHGGDSATVQEAALLLVADGLLRRAKARRSEPGAPLLTPATLHEVLSHIDDHLPERLTVERLAAVAGLPRRTFAAQFKLHTGIPVHQYVLRQRLEVAKHLLVTTRDPIAEIAALSGFAHQAHLTRVSRRLTGSTPAQLRVHS